MPLATSQARHSTGSSRGSTFSMIHSMAGAVAGSGGAGPHDVARQAVVRRPGADKHFLVRFLGQMPQRATPHTAQHRYGCVNVRGSD